MERKQRFLFGRNGPDALSIALSLTACLILIVSMFLNSLASSILWFLALICLVMSYFRILSRNLVRRQLENQRFLQLIAPVTRWLTRLRTRRRQRNLYCFFKCPQCGTILRVPKGKGHLRITCKSCRHVFERNT